jgi:hypothetical protein
VGVGVAQALKSMTNKISMFKAYLRMSHSS